VIEVAKQYSDVAVDYMFVDNAACKMIARIQNSLMLYLQKYVWRYHPAMKQSVLNWFTWFVAFCICRNRNSFV